ncbi:PAS domain S-box protein [Methanolobus sediminis]|uniref:PAS domain S-box protein n=1 Tax=Methanolobus sediminis TaxID=3072978 RepID=A0AA51UL39_9EURY|nr:PAS domain-containing protein [Methanolobus sediminis]WMW25554.1 PAS domain S-box protein [Methanolobus sediminis]
MDLYKHETTKIKSLLKNNPRGMSVTDISKHIGVNRNTVAKYLELLRISGHIEMENIGTAKVYFLSQRIPVSTLLNFSSDHIVVIDDNNRVVQTNDRFIDLTNLSKNDVQGKKITDILPPMISNKTFMDRINDARSGYQQIETFDFFVDNELCFFKTKLIPSTFDDGENGITLIMENITEEINSRNLLKRQQERLEILVSQRTSELEEANKMLKKEISDRKNIEEELRESEKKYRLLADNTFDSIWQLNEDLVFTYANPATMEINHFEAEDFIGTKLHDHFPDSEMKKMMDIMSQKFKNSSDGEYARIETVIYDKNKNLIPIEIYAKRLFDENGKFCGYQGTTKKRTV